MIAQPRHIAEEDEVEAVALGREQPLKLKPRQARVPIERTWNGISIPVSVWEKVLPSRSMVQ